MGYIRKESLQHQLDQRGSNTIEPKISPVSNHLRVFKLLGWKENQNLA